MIKLIRILFVFLAVVTGLHAQVTITRTSSTIFRTDFGNSLDCAYAAYRINNTGVTDLDTVSATIGDFTGANLNLATNAASMVNLGPIAAGDSKMAYFYLQAQSLTAAAQSHTVSL